ncbi:helix-turn-helix domain-containing protein [Moheibacter sediminis]|uniref:Helix-turn-helix n=1 Tax=Moheibacter sediminis TaxID=1434700 RepID=A0A1W1ZLG9_9FLAO|nr:helix-turn-helix transcriptional regulator [Moheibacter sediminis]SMC49266.1 Helix-turn-helix [Moheibacter sediminis]
MGVGIKIRRLREERKMSQDELADLLGIAQTSISNIQYRKQQNNTRLSFNG